MCQHPIKIIRDRSLHLSNYMINKESVKPTTVFSTINMQLMKYGQHYVT
jgi:hypothetical protein